MFTNQDLINHLEQAGVLHSPQIKAALECFPREYFIPESLKDSAYEDRPLPIGEGQTISQPYTIIFMLEALKVGNGDKVLEIGAGSGWQTALLSYLVGDKGRVWAYEIKSEVARFGQDNLDNFHLKNINYSKGDALAYARKQAPYDRIIAGAAFGNILEIKDLSSLLAIDGRMVVPTSDNDIRLVECTQKDKFKEKVFPGFVFVPLTH